MAELHKLQPTIEAEGAQVAFVHLGTEEQAAPFFSTYGMPNAPRFSDPEKRLYRAFGLEKGTLPKLFSLEAFARGLPVFLKFGVGTPVGDVTQMPGTFVLQGGRILCAYRHANSASRPNYVAMVAETDPCCCGAE